MAGKTAKKYVETPLMKQYYDIKAKHPDAILLFRVGDFYETFGDDAIKTAQILGITLTKRANGAASYVELAGFPHHSLDTYLPKLVRTGERVAICEQLEDPKKTKKIVKRGITELITPGISLHDNVLEHKENNFLASVFMNKKSIGVSFLDISTGEFLAAQGSASYIDKLLNSFMPKEVLFPKGKEKQFDELFGSKFCTFTLDDWIYTHDAANDRLTQHFEVSTLKGFGVHDLFEAIIASGAILHYLDITKHHQVQHISELARIEEEKYVWLDRFTIRNLELFTPLHEGAKTLVDIIDKTMTPMASRMLKRWVALPLKEVKPINHRLDITNYFVQNPEKLEDIQQHLYQVGDLERIISKVATSRISPREIVLLKNALSAIIPIKEMCDTSDQQILKHYGDQINLCETMRNRIEKEIVNDPPIAINRGHVFQEGVSEELDEYRKLAFSGKDYLAQIQKRESERTGISSLKIAFNNVFGYYIEVRNTHKDKVPEEWIRKQTLVSAERYITEELKEYETKIINAEAKIEEIETQLYNDLVFSLLDYIAPIQLNANILSRLDCLASFATVAKRYNYCRPEINNGYSIEITQGRHPVIEQQLPLGESYIANDITLDKENQQVIIITGPNMAGKSALLRQTALITLMAQIGCYVPAQAAKIGYVDKIFTRVGASDNISLGESTFMVEMNEAASILNNLSDRSLILLDELGRGTSTYDGISIAWSIVEYIHENNKGKAKTLFATHYHELNDMEQQFSRVKNYNVSIKETNNKIIFMRKLVPGGSNHSFGIHVAKMAGMPKWVTARADEILAQLEQKNGNYQQIEAKQIESASTDDDFQLSLFQLDDPVLSQVRDEILNTDVNNLTPIEALNKLNEIKKILGK